MAFRVYDEAIHACGDIHVMLAGRYSEFNGLGVSAESGPFRYRVEDTKSPVYVTAHGPGGSGLVATIKFAPLGKKSRITIVEVLRQSEETPSGMPREEALIIERALRDYFMQECNYLCTNIRN